MEKGIGCRVKLSLEIPQAHLEHLSPLTDIDFALAHLMLNEKPYREFYQAQQRRGRIIILDNGYYEQNEPLPIPDLMEASRLLNPAVCIAPDKLGEPEWTFKQWETMSRMFAARGIRTRVGCNVTGRDPAESASMMTALASRSCPWLFLPFREPRLDWIGSAWNIIKRFPAIHLLGVNSAEEVTEFARLEREQNLRISLDTSKPIKFALAGKEMPSKGSLRGGGKLDHAAKLDQVGETLIYKNICILRKLMTV